MGDLRLWRSRGLRQNGLGHINLSSARRTLTSNCGKSATASGLFRGPFVPRGASAYWPTPASATEHDGALPVPHRLREAALLLRPKGGQG